MLRYISAPEPEIDEPTTELAYVLGGYVSLRDHEGLPGNTPPWGTLNSRAVRSIGGDPARQCCPRRPMLRKPKSQTALGFASGSVCARDMNPRGHTRLPRYTRGRHGHVVRDHSVFALQDTDVNGQPFGDRPQHVYTVRFAARELWGDPASPLADELKTAEASSEPDDGSQYYHHWVAALERLVTAKGLTDSPVLLERKEAWAEAYLHTPHGKPVTRRRT